MIESTTMVARMAELVRLDQFLSAALVGEGGICFVSGHAGTGKTLLTQQFALRAAKEHADLLIVRGMCDAQSGYGDAYAPFRDVITMLVGNLEEQVEAQNISAENARRLNKALDFSVKALLDHAPDLIGTVVPWGKIPAKLLLDLTKDAKWRTKFERNSRKTSLQDVVGSTSLDQGQLYEQCANMLCRIAQHQPLLIIIDDLHWADPTSIGLLFRLGRRLVGHKILVVGTYRPEELTVRSGQRHPLQKVLNEFERYFGDIHVDLDRCVRERGNEFVETLLASQPNQFDPAFGKLLWRKTRGHPMFTIELLQTLVAHNAIYRTHNGEWAVRSNINWEELPSRVEGVIKEKLARLSDAQRQLVTIGAVEGEQFNAETIARITSNSTRELVAELSGPLHDVHHIVDSVGIKRINKRRLPFYRFSQHLFHSYLYGDLDAVERPFLHEDVAVNLEELYGEEARLIAGQLAHHFEQAELPEKAQYYWRIAGEKAATAYANDEALEHFGRALALLDASDADNRIAILLARETILNRTASRQAQDADLNELEQLTAHSLDAALRADVLLRRSAYLLGIGRYEAAFELAEKAANLASGVQDSALEARAYHRCGRTLWHHGNYIDAEVYLELGLELAQNLAQLEVVAACFYDLAVVAYYQANYDLTDEIVQQAQAAYEAIDSRPGILHCVNLAGITALAQGKYGVALERLEESLGRARRVGWRSQEARILQQISATQIALGEYGSAEDNVQYALEIANESNNDADTGILLDTLGLISYFRGQLDDAQNYLNQALTVQQALGNQRNIGFTQLHMGMVMLANKAPQAARTALSQALEIRRSLGEEPAIAEVAVLLAATEVALDNVERATLLARDFAPFFERETYSGLSLPLLTLWTYYRTLNAVGDEDAADSVLDQAYDLLTARADMLDDEQMRRRFLENVPHVRAIVAERGAA